MKTGPETFKLLSKNAQRVQEVLNKYNLNLDVKELPSTTKTAQNAADSIGCKVASIIKSLIFRTESNNPVLILASGENQVALDLVEKQLGEKLLKADAKFVKENTDFPIGGVAPVAHKIMPKHTLIDVDLSKQEERLWAAAGTPNAVFSLTFDDLVKITSGKIIPVSEKKGQITFSKNL